MKIFRLATVICSGMIVFMNQSGAAESETSTPKNVAVESAAATSQPTTDVAAPDATAAFFGAGSAVSDKYQNWLNNAAEKTLSGCRKKGKDLSLPECNLEKIVVYGDASVQVPSTHPDWIHYRALAYSEAVIQALSKFAEQQALTNKVKMVREFTRDNTPLPDDPFRAENQISSMIDKVMALSGGMLDKFLEKYDIDPKQYDQLPPEKRKALLSQTITVISQRSALADCTGLMPLTTIEADDGKGGTTIRVVYVTSADRIQMVKTMFRQGARIEANADKRAARSVRDRYVNVSEQILFSMFGPRFVWDENGYPVLISYGQAGVDKAADRTEQNLLIDDARDLARQAAINELTILLHGSILTKVEQQERSRFAKEDVRQRQADGSVLASQESSTTLAKSTQIKQELSGRISNFAGIQEVLTWQWVEPSSGKPVVGSIVMWSPETASLAHTLKNTKASSISQPQTQTTPAAKPAAASVKQSMETDDYEF